MKSIFRIAVVASLVGASATPAFAQQLPAASAIIDKYLVAVGGKDALTKISSIHQTATMEIPTMGLKADMEMYRAAPNLMLVKQNIPGVGEIVQGFDGTVGWSTDPMQGPRLQTGKELAQLQEQARFMDNMLYSRNRYSVMENVGLVDFNGEKAYKLRLVSLPGAFETFEYFSAASGLQIGTESTQQSDMGSVNIAITQGDYAKFGDVMLATKMEMQMGSNHVVTKITDVKFNAVAPSVFELPPQVKALIKP